jgi:hypothetical protein
MTRCSVTGLQILFKTFLTKQADWSGNAHFLCYEGTRFETRPEQ